MYKQFQETHEDLAERLGLHVVEMRKERGYFPVVVASPSQGFTKGKKTIDEKIELEIEFDRLYYGGKVEYIREKTERFAPLKSWRRKKVEVQKRRNQYDLHIQRLAGLI